MDGDFSNSDFEACMRAMRAFGPVLNRTVSEYAKQRVNYFCQDMSSLLLDCS